MLWPMELLSTVFLALALLAALAYRPRSAVVRVKKATASFRR